MRPGFDKYSGLNFPNLWKRAQCRAQCFSTAPRAVTINFGITALIVHWPCLLSVALKLIVLYSISRFWGTFCAWCGRRSNIVHVVHYLSGLRVRETVKNDDQNEAAGLGTVDLAIFNIDQAVAWYGSFNMHIGLLPYVSYNVVVIILSLYAQKWSILKWRAYHCDNCTQSAVHVRTSNRKWRRTFKFFSVVPEYFATTLVVICSTHPSPTTKLADLL